MYYITGTKGYILNHGYTILYHQVCILEVAHLYAEGDKGDKAVVLNHFCQFLIQVVELFEKGVGCQVIDQVGQV